MNHEIAVRLLFTLAVIFAMAGLGMMVRWAFWGRSDSQSRMGVRFGVEAAMLAAICFMSSSSCCGLMITFALSRQFPSPLYGPPEEPRRCWKL